MRQIKVNIFAAGVWLAQLGLCITFILQVMLGSPILGNPVRIMAIIPRCGWLHQVQSWYLHPPPPPPPPSPPPPPPTPPPQPQPHSNRHTPNNIPHMAGVTNISTKKLYDTVQQQRDI